jgi:hypothetical protein
MKSTTETGMPDPQKTYAMTLDQLRLMADVVSALDGISRRGNPDDARRHAMIESAHSAIILALGDDIGEVYAPPDEPELT